MYAFFNKIGLKWIILKEEKTLVEKEKLKYFQKIQF